MAGYPRVKTSAVLVTAGAVVAATAIAAAFLLGCGSGTPEPEAAPAPSDAPTPGNSVVVEVDDALTPGNSVVAEVDAAPSSSQTSIVTDDGIPTGSSADVDSEAAVEPSAEASVDKEPDLAVEIVEELAPTEPVGGARQEEPVEPVEPVGPEESDGTGGSGRTPSAQGDVYTWHDGDRMGEARLQLDLVVITEDVIAPNEDVVADMGDGQIVTRSAEEAGGASRAAGSSGEAGTSSQPVFLSESGELMTLPGGVVLVLDEDWDSDSADGFLARNGISRDRVSELDYLTNGFFVETEPGFPSLELANALAAQDGVELSSPNWWRDRTTR